ncbi:MAG: hypothetical protein JNM07_05265 [Phycisphaerae bacterium]|nr:hypothetical protein [Phycisphaerae bacterium]
MGTPDARPPTLTRVRAYQISERGLEPIEWPLTPPPGVILGRAADTSGFLIERINDDGSRWIGRLDWVSGQPAWLVRGSDVNAMATLTSDGMLIWSRRTQAGAEWTLMLRTPSGQEVPCRESSSTALIGVTTGDPGVVYALAGWSGQLELWTLGLDRQAPSSPRWGPLLARRPIGGAADQFTAYQCAAAAPPIIRAETGSTAESGVVLFHPRLGGMAVYDRRADEFRSLGRGSAAAVRSPFVGNPGYLTSTTDGLVFIREGLNPAQIPGARVLADPYVPRLTTDSARPVILIGPGRKGEMRLQVVAMRAADPETDSSGH